MGKRGQANKRGQGWQHGYGSAAWYGAPWRQPWGQGTEASQSVATMRYDQVVLSGNATPNKPNVEPHGEAVPMNVTQLVQKAVNVSRKASSKVKRLEQEITLKQQQWQEFQKMLKQAFRSQLTQFETDVNRLAKDLGEARQSAAEAEQKPKEATVQHGSGEASEPVKMEMEDAWDASLQAKLGLRCPSLLLPPECAARGKAGDRLPEARAGGRQFGAHRWTWRPPCTKQSWTFIESACHYSPGQHRHRCRRVPHAPAQAGSNPHEDVFGEDQCAQKAETTLGHGGAGFGCDDVHAGRPLHCARDRGLWPFQHLAWCNGEQNRATKPFDYAPIHRRQDHLQR